MHTQAINKRPRFLTYLCLGSFTVGSLWIIMFLTLIIQSEFFDQSQTSLFPGIALDYYRAGIGFIIAEIVLLALGLKAVFMMWKMNKHGFYLYLLVKTTLYFLPVIVIGYSHLYFLSLILTAILIIMYGVHFTKRPEQAKK